MFSFGCALVVALSMTRSVSSLFMREDYMHLPQIAGANPEPPESGENAFIDWDAWLDDLWNGFDVMPSTHTAADEVFNGSSPTRQDGVQVHILGMYDSGTNLLWELLAANIGSLRVGGVDSCKKKHMPPRFIEQYLSALRQEGNEFVTVAMVRSPLAQLSGWAKAPYGLGPCLKKLDWLDDNKTVCRLPVRGLPQFREQEFAGPTAVWNNYVQEYHRLATSTANTSQRIMIVEYERLVFSPKQVIHEIAEAIGAKLDWPIKMVGQPAKHHGHPSGRQQAIASISEMTYMDRSPLTEVGVPQALCSHLNKSLMQQHTIPTAPRHRSYEADCAQSFA